MSSNEELNQFTFFRSYFEAIEDLPDKVRLNVLEAIIEYALYGKEITVSGTAKVAFKLCKPTIDRTRAKALGGRRGGTSKSEASTKHTASIDEASSKHSESSFDFALLKDKEKEKDMDKDKEEDKSLYVLFPNIGG